MKTLSIKDLWTTLADRRRAGPPAFRRKYRQQPNATLSFPRWALAFSRSKSTFSDGEGPGAAPENTYTKYPPKMRNFKNFPYDFPKNLHAAPYR